MGTGFELGNDGPSLIVVGVDGSPTSWHAAAYAVGLARRQDARLFAVYVRQFTPALAAALGATSAACLAAGYDYQDDIEAGLRQAIQQEIPRTAVDLRLLVRVGDPFTELTAVAREMRADALVVGVSAGLGHRVAGSLALRLVRAGQWPVTVVP
jgi:nucleotide-binding universal stress UspA family protein